MIGSLPPQLLRHDWFDRSQRAVLPAILGFEVGEGETIMKIPSNLMEIWTLSLDDYWGD